jgi:hypothetical protein
MAIWYVSSAGYALISAFVASTTYTVGQIVKPSAPTYPVQHAYVVTTATSAASTEPTWPTTAGSTVTTGGVTFTCVTGNSTYGWAACAGALGAIATTRISGGDTVYCSSDHAETASSMAVYAGGSGSTVVLVSVNRGGSVPPAVGDYLAGAAFTNNGGLATALSLASGSTSFFIGFAFSSNYHIELGSSSNKLHLKNCKLTLTANTAACRIGPAAFALFVILENTTVQFANLAQSFGGISTSNSIDILWKDTPSAIQGTVFPTSLFTGSAQALYNVTCRGVDFSALVSGKALVHAGSSPSKYLFDSCLINSAVTRYNTTSIGEVVDLVNCFDGTNFLNEHYDCGGSIVTNRTITLSSGAADDIGAFSHQMASNTSADDYELALESFFLDVENTLVGASHTATVEIVSSGTLNTNDVVLNLEYPGTSGSPVPTAASTGPATPMSSTSAIPTSSATWASSPSTPVYQHLQITFTPQEAGRVRGSVKLGKPSTTVYIDPRLVIV